MHAHVHLDYTSIYTFIQRSRKWKIRLFFLENKPLDKHGHPESTMNVLPYSCRGQGKWQSSPVGKQCHHPNRTIDGRIEVLMPPGSHLVVSVSYYRLVISFKSRCCKRVALDQCASISRPIHFNACHTCQNACQSEVFYSIGGPIRSGREARFEQYDQ